MNEREEQIQERLQAHKEGLSSEQILPVHLSVKETQQLMADVEYLLGIVSDLRKAVPATTL